MTAPLPDNKHHFSEPPPVPRAPAVPVMSEPEDTNRRVPLAPGSQVGEYTIISKLGQGGFGITYRAHHTTQGSIVVIKEHIPSELAVRVAGTDFVCSESPETEARYKATLSEFLEEVVVLMGLEHPGIVPIISGFEANGTAYYVMPYVEGQTLQVPNQVSLDKNKQAIEARKITQQLRSLLYTLEYLAQNGIVHRDIKPENIVVTAEGHPILLDFGSARQLQDGKVYTNIYTPDFCAPEQSTARTDAQMSAAIGTHTDIYALGATFYYLITRLLPPKADMRTHSSPDPYKPLAGRPHLEEIYSSHFLQSIDRALQLQPSERWNSAADWRESIESGIIPPPSGLAKRMRILTISSISVVAAMGALSIWALKEKNYAMQIYDSSLGFTEGMLYDFNEALADIPGSTSLQKQLGNNLKNYLNSMEKLPMAQDEKLRRALAIAWKNLGSVNAQQGELEAATEAYRNATKLLQSLQEETPENNQYRYELARTWLLRADIGRRRNMNEQARVLVNQALNVLRALCDQSPDNPDYRCDLGLAMEYAARLAGNVGNREQRNAATRNMTELYRQLVAQYNQHERARVGLANALINQARLCMEQEDFAQATQLLNEAHDTYATLAMSQPHRLSFKAGRATEAYVRGCMYNAMAAGAALEELRNDFDTQALTSFKESIAMAEELETLDPHNAEYPFQQCRAMAHMVDILQRQGVQNQAEAYSHTILQKISKLLQSDPDNTDYAMIKAGAYRGLAKVHAATEKYHGKAAEELAEYRKQTESLLQNTPSNPAFKNMYADALQESAIYALSNKDFRQAAKWLQQAIFLWNELSSKDGESAINRQRLEKAHKLLEQCEASVSN